MSSWRQNKQRQEEHRNNEDTEVYNIGTMIAGTDRSLEDSISGYTPVIVDRRGNRRFHGAFTGGFSAGHFNTVGSVQGYTPKYNTWTSSRNNRNQQSIRQTPMDFMDDEDMATNTNLLTTSQQFNSLNNESMNVFNENKSNMSKHFGNKMTDYLTVDNNTMFNHTKGIQLLKKCGWRAGKNIGDKSNITRLKLLLKRQDQLLLNNDNKNNTNNTDILFGDHILNTAGANTDDNNIGDDSNDKLVSIYRPKMKTDSHGVGYDADIEDEDDKNIKSAKHSGYKRSNSCNDSHTFGPLKKKQKLLASMNSARHGLSALEEVEIGDDVYGDDMTQNIEYDTFITHSDNGDNDDDIVFIKDRKLEDKKLRLQIKQHMRMHKKKQDNRIRSRDGTLPINGFVVAKMADNYQYTLKQQIRSSNYNKNRNNFGHGYSGHKKFETNKMEIDKEFVNKFANFDLTVGSFLCRNVDRKSMGNKVLNDEGEIPEFIPDAQQRKMEQREENKLSKHLSNKFKSEETMTSDEHIGGLRAGLTLSAHIPGKNSNIRKAKDMLNDIRRIYGNQSAEKLLRFDVFIADKIGIESPIDMEAGNSLIFDDGNKTQFELNEETYWFEEEWDKLKQYGEYLYADKVRIRQKEIEESAEDKIYNKGREDMNMSVQQAAKCNLYGEMTRTVEMWIPDRLLCKRCNIRDPYEGMYNEQKNKKGNGKSGQLFGGMLLNNKENNNKMKRISGKMEEDVIQTRSEQVAAILDENESDKQPPILQLKQLKTWNSYLNETTQNNSDNINKKCIGGEDPEMRSFIDGILNDESDHDDEDMTEKDKKDEIQDTKQEQQGFSLFKSIFENDATSDSDSNCDDDQCLQSEHDDSGKIVVEKEEINEDKDEIIEIKEVIIIEDEDDDEEDGIQRKKFKFVAKSDRKDKSNISRGFEGIGFMNRKRDINENMDVKRSFDVRHRQLQLNHESDEDDNKNHNDNENEMVWTVVDNLSSNSSNGDNESDDDRIKHKKKKKRREKKSKKKKSKKKKSKHKKRSKKKHKYKR